MAHDRNQNINAAACYFCQTMGCTLRSIDRFAYPGLPSETRLLWWRAPAGGGLSALVCRLVRGDP
jgi:hypothetical protein